MWPGETGKVVPQERTITAPDLNVRFTPPIGQRNIRFAAPDGRDGGKGFAWLGSDVETYRAALAKRPANRVRRRRLERLGDEIGGNNGIVGGAAGGGLRGGWAEWGATHPEWFALQADGTRDQSKAKERWRLC